MSLGVRKINSLLCGPTEDAGRGWWRDQGLRWFLLCPFSLPPTRSFFLNLHSFPHPTPPQPRLLSDFAAVRAGSRNITGVQRSQLRS